MEGQVEYRIGWLSACLVLSIAIVADLLQILLTLLVAFAPVSDIVTVLAEGCIGFYFYLRGVHFLKGRGSTGRAIFFFITTIIEMVPFLDALPTLAFDTIYNIHSARKEDRQLFKERQEEAAKEAAIQSAQDDALARAYYLQAANEERRAADEAANDNEEGSEGEEDREAA